jgi:hypothetical protein
MVFFLFLAAVLISSMNAFGSVAPDVTLLLNVYSPKFPGKVAADRYGSIYVADIYLNRVRVYHHDGAIKHTLSLSSRPTALAVSPDDHLYVGTMAGSINVYNLHGDHLQTLDISAIPLSIAFLSSGEMYVIDFEHYCVMVFDQSLNRILVYGSYGDAPGSFIDPKSIAINEEAGQVYVLDRGYKDMEGSYSTYVWRVQVFDLSGNYLRSFSHYGFGEDGKLGSASSIAVDSQDRVYVSDNVQHIIGVYDSSGTYLSTIYDNANPIYNPVNMSYANGRLYIASILSTRIFVYGIDAYPLLGVNPSDITITYQPGMSDSSEFFSVFNDGGGLLMWEASTTTPWLSVIPANGELQGESSQDAEVQATPAGLVTGTYAGSIDVLSNGGAEKVNVALEVAAPPVLMVTPTSFDMEVKKRETVDPIPVTIQLSNDLSDSLRWNAVSDAGWLGIVPDMGPSNTIPVQAGLTVNTDMDPDYYSGHITVTAVDANGIPVAGVEGSPTTITVMMELISSGKITVTTNTDDATWTINGLVTYEGGGTHTEIEDVEEGTYEITYHHVPGFKSAPSESLTLAPGEEITFTGEYIDLRKEVNIIASHGPGPNEPSVIAIFRADGSVVDSFSAFPASERNASVVTSVGDVDGDGQLDIVAGSGPAANTQPEVMGLSVDGTPIAGLAFIPFETKFGTTLAKADFDGDGKSEIITGQGRMDSLVRVFSFDGGVVSDTGVSILSYPGLNVGVRVAAADLDGDEVPELITSPERAEGVPVVNIFSVDTSGGMSNWTVQLATSFPVCNEEGGTNLTTGDIDADAISEIMVVCPSAAGTEVRVYDTSGILITSFPTGTLSKDYIAAGDTNMDGIAEIIIGDGPADNRTEVKVFDTQGTLLRRFEAFDRSFGVRVTTGDFGY